MKKSSWALLLSAIALMSFSLPGWTQTESEEELIDLQTMTCRETLKSHGEDRANILIFMHGYISGQQEETAINPPVLSNVTDRILDACIDNPERTLLSVFEESR